VFAVDLLGTSSRDEIVLPLRVLTCCNCTDFLRFNFAVFPCALCFPVFYSSMSDA
jgi:hypothetical protein